MPGVALVGSNIRGTTTGEHAGHYDEDGNPIHGAGVLTGTITSGSAKVKVNGVSVAIEGSATSEQDNCDSGVGKLGNATHKLRINGVSVQCIGDSTVPHNGTASIISGISKLITV